jgi:hypothetical protein
VIYDDRTDISTARLYGYLSRETLEGRDTGFLTFGRGFGFTSGYYCNYTRFFSDFRCYASITPSYYLDQGSAQGLALLINQSGSGFAFTVTVMTSARCGASYGTPGKVAESGFVPAVFFSADMVHVWGTSALSANARMSYFGWEYPWDYYQNQTQNQCINPTDFYSVNSSGFEYGITIDTSQVPLYIKNDFVSITSRIDASPLADSGPCWHAEVSVSSLTPAEYSLYLRVGEGRWGMRTNNFQAANVMVPSNGGLICFNNLDPSMFLTMAVVLAININITSGVDRTITLHLRLTRPVTEITDDAGNIVPCRSSSAPAVSAPVCPLIPQNAARYVPPLTLFSCLILACAACQCHTHEHVLCKHWPDNVCILLRAHSARWHSH